MPRDPFDHEDEAMRLVEVAIRQLDKGSGETANFTMQQALVHAVLDVAQAVRESAP